MSRPSLSAITERAFSRQVESAARAFGWQLYHTWLSARSAAGFPDLLLCRPPRIIFAELKADAGRVTPAQQAWLDLLGKCPGVECYCWRPRDWDSIVATLQATADLAEAGDGPR